MFDFYRKVPEDLKQATQTGGLMSILWLVMLGWIVLAETGRFLKSEYRSRILNNQPLYGMLDASFQAHRETSIPQATQAEDAL